MKLLLHLALFLTVLSSTCFGQIHGKIFNKKGEPIEFANIFLLKHPSYGCISNDEGEFLLTVPNDFKTNDTLTISHLAYKIKKIPVIGKNLNLDIELFDNEINLNEIVITPISNYINKIIERLPQNYPSKETLNTYNLVVQNFRNDSTILGYFNGIVNMKFRSYIGNKKNIRGFISDNYISINRYKDIPNFYYKTPSIILSLLFPENLPFLKKFEDYDFEISLKRNYGIVNFKPKVSNKFMYQGTFYFDLNTYAILYVKMKLIYNKDNKDKLISIGFRKSSTYTNYKNEVIEIFFSQINSEKLEVDKMLYKSSVEFEKRDDHYDMNTQLYLVRKENSSEQLHNLRKLNLYSLKTSKKGVNKNRPFLDPMMKKAIEEIINEKEK